MKTNTSRIFCVIAGVLLVIAGFFCLTHQGDAILTVAILLGVFMLIAGIVEICLFAGSHGRMLGAGWMLLDGILTTVLGLLLLFNRAFTVISLPFMFSMWLMFSGISRVVSSLDLRAVGAHGWGWITALGVLLIIGSLCTMFDPVAGLMAIGLTTGLALILEGVDTIVAGFISSRPL